MKASLIPLLLQPWMQSECSRLQYLWWGWGLQVSVVRAMVWRWLVAGYDPAPAPGQRWAELGSHCAMWRGATADTHTDTDTPATRAAVRKLASSASKLCFLQRSCILAIISFNVAHIPNVRSAGAKCWMWWRAIQRPDNSAHYAVMNLAARVTTRSAPVGASSVSIIHFYDSPWQQSFIMRSPAIQHGNMWNICTNPANPTY